MNRLEIGRLAGARAIVAEIARHLEADASVELWNGEVLPLGRNARDDIRIRIASPAAVGRLLRSPRLTTLVEVYLSGDLDITGGSPLEALGRWDHLKAVHLKRTVDRKLILRAALPFLTARRPADAGMGFAARVRRVAGRGRDDLAMIQFHYDVSNAFYALFLGREMQYSAAVFDAADQDLDAAQEAKLDLICTKLRLAPGKRLLDIGCGWGGLACHAAERFGASVHGVTLSQAQHDAAHARVRSRGLEGKVTIELRDYRTLDTPEGYDAIAQIGMFEHVGLDNHDTFFAQMARLLVPAGLYLHQATTRRATRDLSAFRKRTAYMKVINRWIFPGGELDYLGMTATNLERWGFEVRGVETMREHYYLTLKAWSERLYARREEAVAEAGLTRTRLWLLYFALSCTGFWRGVLCDFQTLAQKKVTGLSGLPLR
jgi:cyclopropane-fatty-acyl-phospholipid synthase